MPYQAHAHAYISECTYHATARCAALALCIMSIILHSKYIGIKIYNCSNRHMMANVELQAAVNACAIRAHSGRMHASNVKE